MKTFTQSQNHCNQHSFSGTHNLKVNTFQISNQKRDKHEKLQNKIQKQAQVKYNKYKKSASQPPYFMSDHRLKKMSDIYRAASLQKLQRNISSRAGVTNCYGGAKIQLRSAHSSPSKSFHSKVQKYYTSTTPENSIIYGGSKGSSGSTSKKNPNDYTGQLLNTLNFNQRGTGNLKLIDSTEKTKRLTLNTSSKENQKVHKNHSFGYKTLDQVIDSNHIGTSKACKNQNSSPSSSFCLFSSQMTNFFNSINAELQKISTLSMEKAFLGQYQHFFYMLTGKGNSRSFASMGQNMKNSVAIDLKVHLSRFSHLIEVCQKKVLFFNEQSLKKKYQDIEREIGNLVTQNRKKSFKIELLSKELGNLKDKNLQLSREIAEMKSSKSYCDNKLNSNKNYQINQEIQLQVKANAQNEIQTPIYQYNFVKQNDEKQQKQKQAQKPRYDQKSSEKIKMIRRIRSLEQKQKDLIKTMMLLKHSGVNIQKAFQEAVIIQNFDPDSEVGSTDRLEAMEVKHSHKQTTSEKKLQKQLFRKSNNKIPQSIKKIPLNISYEADESVLSQLNDLTIQYYFDDEPIEEYMPYKIKREYKAKPLKEEMQQKLKLNFDALYEDDDLEEEFSYNSQGGSAQDQIVSDRQSLKKQFYERGFKKQPQNQNCSQGPSQKQSNEFLSNGEFRIANMQGGTKGTIDSDMH